MKDYPFSIFALAPFPGSNCVQDLPPLIGPFDIYDLDEGLRSLECTIDIPLPGNICRDENTQIKIENIADLKPKNLVRCSTFLSSLVDALDYVKTHRTDPEAMAVGLQHKFGHLLLDLSVLASNPEPRSKPKSDDPLLDSIFSKVAMPDDKPAAPQLDVQIEKMLETALACIYSDTDFRQLESTIRGLQMLVRQGPVKKSTKTSVTLCNVDTSNLENALRNIVRSSAAQSPSLVLIDMPFDNSFASVDMLETLANFSEAIQVPTVVHLTASFFGKNHWSELSSVGYLANELETGPYAKFKALQNASSTRWLTLAMPEICFRNPYGVNSAVGPVLFEEPSEVWVSPVWAVGTLAVKSQMAFGWPSQLTNQHTCQVEQMVIPKHTGKTTPLSTLFKEDRLTQLNKIGMAPLGAIAKQEPIFMTQAPSMNKDTLGFQLFANRVIGFFHNQKAALEAQPIIPNPSTLVEHLQTAFIAKWKETEQPLPDDFVIRAGHTDNTGQVVLAVRMTPPRAIVPETKLLEFNIAFAI